VPLRDSDGEIEISAQRAGSNPSTLTMQLVQIPRVPRQEVTEQARSVVFDDDLGLEIKTGVVAKVFVAQTSIAITTTVLHL